MIRFFSFSVLILAAWIGREEHAAWLQAGTKFAEYTGEGLGGDAEKRCVRKNAVKDRVGKVECQEILMEHRHAGKIPCHVHEGFASIDARRRMSSFLEVQEVSAGPTAKIQNLKGRFGRDRVQQGINVLRDIVITGALPEGLGPVFVVLVVGVVVAGVEHRVGDLCAAGGCVRSVLASTVEGRVLSRVDDVPGPEFGRFPRACDGDVGLVSAVP